MILNKSFIYFGIANLSKSSTLPVGLPLLILFSPLEEPIVDLILIV